jgi:hypothetical protein
MMTVVTTVDARTGALTVDIAGARRSPTGLLMIWALSRLLLLMWVQKVFVFPGPDVTSDVSSIYRGWYEVLVTGVFPEDDVTWQYPPAAALAILSPALLPFLPYTTAFFLLAFAADLVVLSLLMTAGTREGGSMRGAWLWIVGVPLLGPTVYARYDLMVTAVAVAALLCAARRPRVAGALIGFGAMLKVWPVLLLTALRGRSLWMAAAVTASGLAAAFAVTMPGAFAFLTFQADRGTEVESLGALVFHIARHHGWEGEVLLHYGSVEFLGPWVDLVSRLSLALTGIAFSWLLMWRLRAERFAAHTAADAALVAVLLFVTTSRVISPQYMVWLVGLAAVCLCSRRTRMTAPAVLVLVACGFTVLEFPTYFSSVVASDGLGITLLVVRNGLLVTASVLAAVRLWRETVPRDQAEAERPQRPDDSPSRTSVSS